MADDAIIQLSARPVKPIGQHFALKSKKAPGDERPQAPEFSTCSEPHQEAGEVHPLKVDRVAHRAADPIGPLYTPLVAAGPKFLGQIPFRLHPRRASRPRDRNVL